MDNFSKRQSAEDAKGEICVQLFEMTDNKK